MVWDQRSRLRSVKIGDPFASTIRLDYGRDSIVRKSTGKGAQEGVFYLKDGQIHRYHIQTYNGPTTCTVQRETVLPLQLLRLRHHCTCSPNNQAPTTYTEIQYVFLNQQQTVELVTIDRDGGQQPQYRFPPHIEEDLPFGCGNHVFFSYTITPQHRRTFATQHRVSIPLRSVLRAVEGYRVGHLEILRHPRVR